LDLEAEGRDLDPPAVDFDLAALGLEFSESNFAFFLEETAASGAAYCKKWHWTRTASIACRSDARLAAVGGVDGMNGFSFCLFF
jgi:hypothetical protein